MAEGTYRLKRPLDVAASAIGLIVLSPVILVTVLVIRWTSITGDRTIRPG